MTLLDEPDQMRDVIHQRQRWYHVLAWLALLGAGSAVAAGFLGSSDDSSKSSVDTVNSVKLEKQVKAWVVAQFGDVGRTKVECPSGVAVKAGTVFDCFVTDTGAGTRSGVHVAVTVQNDRGDLTWAFDGGTVGLGR